MTNVRVKLKKNIWNCSFHKTTSSQLFCKVFVS